MGEFERLLDVGEVIEIEETTVRHGVQELVLIAEWRRPLHVVVAVDDARREERIVTVYAPEKSRWSVDFKMRKR